MYPNAKALIDRKLLIQDLDQGSSLQEKMTPLDTLLRAHIPFFEYTKTKREPFFFDS